MRDEKNSKFTAIITNGAHSTNCVTIQSTLESQLQISSSSKPKYLPV